MNKEEFGNKLKEIRVKNKISKKKANVRHEILEAIESGKGYSANSLFKYLRSCGIVLVPKSI